MTVGRPGNRQPHAAEPSPRSVSSAGRKNPRVRASTPAQPQKHISASEARASVLVPGPNPTSFCERKSELARPARDAQGRALPDAQWEAKPLPSAVSLATFLYPQHPTLRRRLPDWLRAVWIARSVPRAPGYARIPELPGSSRQTPHMVERDFRWEDGSWSCGS